ncbi:hypothetical protein SDC9_82889 [bioreactor metagenome]|uniref:Uncharacterized protein n=1 Tax=bioreactor metagenome TaxID=1076179 RepID=A0A644ZEJ0_9ZZZZ
MDIQKKDAAKGFLVENVFGFLINGASEVGKQIISQQGLDTGMEMLGGVALDTGLGFVPVVGNAVSSYRMNRKIQNVEALGKELSKRIDSLQNSINTMEIEDKQRADAILDFALVSVESYTQEEKITYLANGIDLIFKNSNISYDISYLYINTLNNLTILDISVLKLYTNNTYANYGKPHEFNSYQDIVDKFNIEYEQYQGIQSNLYRMGILETQTDRSIEKDLSEIEKTVKTIEKDLKNIHGIIGDLINPKKNVNRIPSLSAKLPKIKSTDRYVISKFGREFYQYFISENE